MPVNALIPLAGKTPQPLSMIDVIRAQGDLYRNKLANINLQETRQGIQERNALKSILGQTGALTGQGLPTAETSANALGADPMDWLKIQGDLQTTRLRDAQIESENAYTQRQNMEAVAKQQETGIKTLVPLWQEAITAYQGQLEKNPQLAKDRASKIIQDGIDQMEKSGMLSPDMAKWGRAIQFNPYYYQAMITKYSGQGAQSDIGKLDADLLAGKITQKEHDEAVRKKTALPGSASPWESLVDSEGNQYRVTKDGAISQKRKPDGSWEDINSLPAGLKKLGSTGGFGSAVNQRFNKRTLTAGAEVTRALRMLEQQPMGQTGGMFAGWDWKTGGFTSSASRVLANRLTSQDQIDYNTALSGLALELTTLLRQGMQLNETEINNIEKGARVNPGDTIGNALYKFANVAAKARTALETFEPMNPEEKEKADKLIKALSRYPDPEAVYAKVRGLTPPTGPGDVLSDEKKTGNILHDFSSIWKGKTKEETKPKSGTDYSNLWK